MTDLEISKALALAIGWDEHRVGVHDGEMHIWRVHGGRDSMPDVAKFDYRDWNVIGPIAERFGMTVDFSSSSVLVDEIGDSWLYADTPQKAIALAVIGGAKK